MRPSIPGQVLSRTIPQSPAPQPARVMALPLPETEPPPDLDPDPGPVVAGYDKRSVFRYVGTGNDGGLVVQDAAGQLFKAWPL